MDIDNMIGKVQGILFNNNKKPNILTPQRRVDTKQKQTDEALSKDN